MAALKRLNIAFTTAYEVAVSFSLIEWVAKRNEVLLLLITPLLANCLALCTLCIAALSKELFPQKSQLEDIARMMQRFNKRLDAIESRSEQSQPKRDKEKRRFANLHTPPSLHPTLAGV